MLSLAAADAPANASEPGVRLDFGYTGEAWRNFRGGIARRSAYVDNLEVALGVDAERALGWHGATIRVAGIYSNGGTISENVVGDLQVISNIEADEALRLYEAWVEQQLGAISLKAGVIDLNTEFDVKTTSGLFINGVHGIGLDFGQVGDNGPSLYPITGLGVRARMQFGGAWRLNLGAFEGVPGDPDRPRRTVFELTSDEGALLVGELLYEEPNGLRAAAGLWHHSAAFEDLLAQDFVGEPVEHSGSTGFYAFVEGPVAKSRAHRLDAFVRVGGADSGVHQTARYLGAGVVLSGPLLTADGERLGLALSVAENGAPYRRARNLAGQPVTKRETNIELTYRIQLTPGLALQPDLQYVIDPGTDPGLRNALVGGLRFELSWGL